MVDSLEASAHDNSYMPAIDLENNSDVQPRRLDRSIGVRRVLVAALAFVLAILAVLLSSDSASSSIYLSKTDGKWAQSLLGKVNIVFYLDEQNYMESTLTVLSDDQASPIYILPYNSAVEAGREAADKARQFTKNEDLNRDERESSEKSSSAGAWTVSGGLLHIIKSMTNSAVKGSAFVAFPVTASSTASPDEVGSFPSESQDSPFKFDSVQPSAGDSNPRAEMVELPVPQSHSSQEEDAEEEPWNVDPIDTSIASNKEPRWTAPSTSSASQEVDAAEPEETGNGEKRQVFANYRSEQHITPVEINVNLPLRQSLPFPATPQDIEFANNGEHNPLDQPLAEPMAGPVQPSTESSASQPEGGGPEFAEVPVVLWSYHDPATGPDQWGKIGYNVCSEGTSQSPINIESNIETADLPILAWSIPETSDAFLTKNAAVQAVYNGRTFEVVGLDALMAVDGSEYTLRQIHVHTPSEHKFDGQHYDMEIHLVHVTEVDGQSKYMIVAALFQKAPESADFIREFAAVIPSLSAGKGTLDIDFARMAMAILGQMEGVNPTVTNAQNYFQYTGSFTAPPCAEDVTWVVLKNALPVAAGDVEALARVEGKNNRPTQPLNGRVVLDSHLDQ